MPIKLSFERKTLSFHTDAVGIGRDPENQVAFPNDSRLALQHAILRSVNGRWIVESRDGGPIRIGNGRPSKFAWLNPGDVIYLTETGPELVFEPGSDGAVVTNSRSKPSKASLPNDPPATSAVTAPYIPFIPNSTGDLAIKEPEADKDSLAAHLGPHAPEPIAPNLNLIHEVVDHQSKLRIFPHLLVVSVALLLLLVTGALVVKNRGNQLAKSNPADSLESTPNKAETISNEAVFLPGPQKETVLPTPIDPGPDPREFLVLIGFGNLKDADRPLILGVGWLWNNRIVVTSSGIGTAVEEIKRDLINARQGCVIHHGFANEVEEVIHPAGCNDISILRLKTSMNLSKLARDQWTTINSAGAERQNSLGKRFQYVSYDPFVRSTDLPESYDLPLCEYDRQLCSMNREVIHLEDRSHEHFVESMKLTRGGLVIDEHHRIVGMAPLYSPIVWTETLERVLGSY